VVQVRSWRLALAAVLGGAVLVAACTDALGSGGRGDVAGGSPTTVFEAEAPGGPDVSEVVVDPNEAGEWSDENAAPTTTTLAAEVPSTTFPAVAQRMALGRTLQPGVTGDDVRRLQERLLEMKFDPGQPDGVFGGQTQHAVWAFQKLVLKEKPTAVVSPEVWDRMQDEVVIAPRRTNTSATHFEVYLPEQTAVLFKNGAPVIVTHISSGDGKEWCSDKAGKCGVSTTPGGIFKFYRRESDWWEGSLGALYNPLFFNYGIAVHGMTSVPNYPASRGCVRIPMNIAEYFPDLVSRGDQVFVWDGKKEPEAYGAQPPPFDRPNPNATTTTSVKATTTTAATTTTKAPATTTTTKAPATTTTRAPATTTTRAPATTTTTKAPPPPTTSPTTAASTTTSAAGSDAQP
jgi:hypothetical protein